MVEPVDTDMNVKGEDLGEEVFYNKEFVKTCKEYTYLKSSPSRHTKMQLISLLTGSEKRNIMRQ